MNPGYSIFVTDPSHSTYFNLDFNSHKGSKIKMESSRWVTEFYNIQIGIKDLSSPKEIYFCNSTKNYSYIKCVDEMVQEQISKVNHSYHFIKHLS